jgi:hypothetical protein
MPRPFHPRLYYSNYTWRRVHSKYLHGINLFYVTTVPNTVLQNPATLHFMSICNFGYWRGKSRSSYNVRRNFANTKNTSLYRVILNSVAYNFRKGNDEITLFTEYERVTR